ncbi:MAG: tetratricopeptide repeat protein [Bacteroidales bacterium]|jgi:tetratricopeptide (TPR) repeat protein|nr:tetratricopeptide repeat protein [Bacteroidales bacterium]
MNRYFILIMALVLCNSVLAQDDTAQDNRFNSIAKMVDNGEYVFARTEIKKALNDGADLFKYSYELAWCDYQLQDYKDALNVLLPLMKEEKATADFYQLLGNTYDEMGESGKAVNTYNEGLNRYPNAGCLYLELGNVAYKQQNFRDALFYYEKGIEIEPTFASNYYRAAQIYLSSTEEVWAVMFGEIFMNLERNTERSKVLSKQLFEIFRNEITLNRTEIEVDFYNPTIIYSDSYERHNLFPQYYKDAMLKACKGEKYLDLASLARIRKKFITELFRTTPDFHNVIFDYHKTLIDNGFFDAYNYWLFGCGSPDESNKWIKEHKKLFDNFMKWFDQNPMPISKNSLFTRYNME